MTDLFNDIMGFFHQALSGLIFASTASNESISQTLVLGGWAFTIVQFVISLVLPAPYGRYTEASPKYLSFGQINSKLAWVLQESPALLVPSILLYESWNMSNLSQKILVGAFILHYFQRACIFPLLMRGDKGTPILPAIMAWLFCCYNGFLQSHSILYVVPFGPKEYLSPTFMFGMLLFVFGMAVNIDSDRRLRNLRNPSKKGTYLIPRGGFFEYVSAANYFGEMCEWWGFALAARLNPAALLFAGFSTLFLGMRGLHHHRFYLEKFREEYPKKRKAVVPFLI